MSMELAGSSKEVALCLRIMGEDVLCLLSLLGSV